MNKRSFLQLPVFAFLIGAFFFCNQSQLFGAKGGAVSQQLSRELTSVVKKAAPAVVLIHAQASAKKLAAQNQDQPDEFEDMLPGDPWRQFFSPLPPRHEKAPSKVTVQGSGFFISKDGLLVTNNHMVDVADPEKIIVVAQDGKEYKAKIVGTDPSTDVALLKVEGADFSYLKFANSVEVGDIVLALGSPFGLKTAVSFGIVSATGRNDLDIARNEDFIQTDAAINHGNSGGPLINMEGDIVGMNTAIASTSSGGSIGIGFTIPSNLIKHVIDEIMQHGKVVRGFLGVTMQRVESDMVAAFGLNKAEGALITDVAKDGPSDVAGIKAGDIILKINDKPIDCVGTLRNFVAFMHPGDVATLSILRDDKTISLKVTVGTFPDHESAAGDVQDNFGILVQELTQELATQYGYTGESGVVIKSVAQNSVAQLAGLKRGQLIISVNRKPIHSPEEFYTIIQESKTGSQLLLRVKEGQATRFVVLKVE